MIDHVRLVEGRVHITEPTEFIIHNLCEPRHPELPISELQSDFALDILTTAAGRKNACPDCLVILCREALR